MKMVDNPNRSMETINESMINNLVAMTPLE